jgi:hypothetical protein
MSFQTPYASILEGSLLLSTFALESGMGFGDVKIIFGFSLFLSGTKFF